MLSQRFARASTVRGAVQAARRTPIVQQRTFFPPQFNDRKVLEEKYPEYPTLSDAEDPNMVSDTAIGGERNGERGSVAVANLETRRTADTSTLPSSRDSSATPTAIGGTSRSAATLASLSTKTTTCSACSPPSSTPGPPPARVWPRSVPLSSSSSVSAVSLRPATPTRLHTRENSPTDSRGSWEVLALCG